jgi:hypothetical protein
VAVKTAEVHSKKLMRAGRFTHMWVLTILQAMKASLIYHPALVLFVASIALIQGIHAQTQAPATQELVWPAPGDEIRSPQFSPDGNFVVLVTRAYWPDGGDAEGLPDWFFKSLEARAKADPRFADPVIKMISLAGRAVCEVRYGWNPSVSQDDKRVVFSEQLKPITGFRELASTQAGNGIRMYDCETSQLTKIADPQTGYLDMPFFSPDGGSVVYTENEAVNGAFGGPVGIAQFDLQQNRTITLLRKETVAAVPCPPPDSKPSGREAFECSEVKSLTQSFPRIVFQAGPMGTDVLALLGRPVPSAGDMYLAQNYDMELASVLHGAQTLVPLGRRSMESDDDTSFQPASGDKVLIFSKYWKLFSVATGKPLADIGPRNTNLKSVYSPDLRYYLRAEAAEPGQDPDHFVLYRTADGKRLKSLRKMAYVYEAVWSPESNRFAIVGVPMTGASAMHHLEQLVIYSVR